MTEHLIGHLEAAHHSTDANWGHASVSYYDPLTDLYPATLSFKPKCDEGRRITTPLEAFLPLCALPRDGRSEQLSTSEGSQPGF